MTTASGVTELGALRQRSDVAGRMLDGAFTLLGAQGRQVHLLNDSATAMWELIGDGTTLEHLVETIAQRFAIDERVVRSDVVNALPSLSALLDIDLDREDAPPIAASSDRVSDKSLVDSRSVRRIGPFRALESTVVVETPSHLADSVLGPLFDDLDVVLAPLVHSGGVEVSGSLITIRATAIETVEGHRRWVLECDGERVAEVLTIPCLRSAVLAQVNAAPIEALRESVGWHAGAVEFPAGVVVFPGHSNAGKSTLVAQLLQRGHGYLTDEAVAIDLQSTAVMTFPKSVCVDPSAKPLFADLASVRQQDWPTWHIDPNRLGPGRLGEPGRPVGFVFPMYDRDALVSMERLSRHEALDALLENSFDFASAGVEGASLLLAFADEVPCYRLRHGGQPEHIALLEDRFG